MRHAAGRALRGGVLVATCLLVVSCDSAAGPSGIIDRDTFIATYVDLRRAALTTTDATLDDEARAEVLERHGVTEQDLLDFADAHGRDVTYVRELWTEVEARMDSLSAAGAEGAPGESDAEADPNAPPRPTRPSPSGGGPS